MANLKDIRRRIRSVKSTQKITQAMRMVAAAKVKRAESRMKAAKPFSDALTEVFSSVYPILQGQLESLEESPYRALLVPRPVKNVGLLVISSDRGLCGAYNGTVIRQTHQTLKKLRAEGVTPHLYLVGAKAVQAFQNEGAYVLGKASMNVAPTVSDASYIAQKLVQQYLEGTIDRIDILSTEFRSMISFKVVNQSLIPVDPDIITGQASSETSGKLAEKPVSSRPQPELLLEPNALDAVESLVPLYLTQTVYMKLLEAAASELASRMMAMTNATKNASDMISQLSLQYNKARQASITQEILEVVSGANALGS